MRLFTTLLCTTLLVPAQGYAGAWMRETGKTFTAVSFNLNAAFDQGNSTYLEFGFRDTLTIGADLNTSTDAQGLKAGKLTLFLRRPVGPADRKYRLSYELGLGIDWEAAITTPHIRTGLSWGRGIKIAEKSGWASIDATYTFSLGDIPHVAKLDGTVGLNFNDRFSGMMQVYLGHSDGTGSASLAPSVIVTSGNGKMRYQFGFESPLGDTGKTSLKVGLWREF